MFSVKLKGKWQLTTKEQGRTVSGSWNDLHIWAHGARHMWNICIWVTFKNSTDPQQSPETGPVRNIFWLITAFVFQGNFKFSAPTTSTRNLCVRILPTLEFTLHHSWFPMCKWVQHDECHPLTDCLKVCTNIFISTLFNSFLYLFMMAGFSHHPQLQPFSNKHF